jgi:tetratricopeptide (TPR) repeat protein
MIMKRIIIFVVVPIIISLISSFGQSQNEVDLTGLITEGKTMIQNGVDQWKLGILLNARGIFERILSVREKDYLSHYYLAYADYRLCIMHVSQNDNNNASQYIDDGIAHLERSVELQPKCAESHALLASLYGFKIGLKWYLGMTLGPKAGSSFDKAVEIDSLNPRVYLLLGISKYYTPSIFGGGMDKAKFNLSKSIKLYENYSASDSLLPNWGHEEAYAWLGKIYMEGKEYQKADEQFEKALKVNPKCSWVKYVLKKELADKTKDKR